MVMIVIVIVVVIVIVIVIVMVLTAVSVVAWHGTARHRIGMAWHSMAWHRVAWRGGVAQALTTTRVEPEATIRITPHRPALRLLSCCPLTAALCPRRTSRTVWRDAARRGAAWRSRCASCLSRGRSRVQAGSVTAQLKWKTTYLPRP